MLLMAQRKSPPPLDLTCVSLQPSPARGRQACLGAAGLQPSPELVRPRSDSSRQTLCSLSAAGTQRGTSGCLGPGGSRKPPGGRGPGRERGTHWAHSQILAPSRGRGRARDGAKAVRQEKGARSPVWVQRQKQRARGCFSSPLPGAGWPSRLLVRNPKRGPQEEGHPGGGGPMLLLFLGDLTHWGGCLLICILPPGLQTQRTLPGPHWRTLPNTRTAKADRGAVFADSGDDVTGRGSASQAWACRCDPARPTRNPAFSASAEWV